MVFLVPRLCQWARYKKYLKRNKGRETGLNDTPFDAKTFPARSRVMFIIINISGEMQDKKLNVSWGGS